MRFPRLTSCTLVRTALVVLLGVVPARGATTAAPPGVVVELDDGTRHAGTLVAIDPRTVEITGADGAARALPVGKVRAIVGQAVPADPDTMQARLTLTDGTTLAGEGFSVAGATATLALPGGPAEMPVARVREVQFVGAGTAPRGAWLEAVPDGVTSDLVVVGKADGFEFVECAITAVSAETVTVILDEETIPVRRSKVVGLRWLRRDSSAAGTVVRVTGGLLKADAVAWTPAGLVLDGDDAERRITLPPAALEGIDYAAGRTTHLATLAPERLEVDPFFGALRDVTGLAPSFATRAVAADGGNVKLDLVIRPRTVATWRLPAQGRRLRTRLVSGSGAGPAVVTLTLDGRPVFERVVSGGEPVPVEIDVAGGRRLVVTVDFGPAGGMAGAVRLLEPVIEQ